MLDLLVGILHLVVFPGGLFALALGLFLFACRRRPIPDFTEPAVKAAKKLKILLWDRGYLESMMEEEE